MFTIIQEAAVVVITWQLDLQLPMQSLPITRRGSQTRTRMCDNEFDTTDGYQQKCNQAGSELHNLETRECPLKGAHDFCTCKIYHLG
jgi:hypothetical protein